MKADRGIIIVSGSNGRIGEAVMRRFAGRFEDVVGFDRQAPQPAPPDCMYVAVDITSDESVRDGLRTIRDHHGAHVASVIHLAAYYDFFGRPSPKYEEITVHGTGRLLRGLRELGFQVEQFVFSSTMLVHRRGSQGSSSPKTGRSSRPGRTRNRKSGPSSSSATSEATFRPCCCGSPASTTTSATRFPWRTRSSASTSETSPAGSTPARPRTAKPSCTWMIWSTPSSASWSAGPPGRRSLRSSSASRRRSATTSCSTPSHA